MAEEVEFPGRIRAFVQSELRRLGDGARVLPYTSLCVFDFDSTLFRSPEPNPVLWDSPTTTWLVSSGTWFSDPGTLSPPNVPEAPGVDWFDAGVVRDAREALADPNCLAILLTGRKIGFMARIVAICAGIELDFPLFFLRENAAAYQTTMDFKRDVLRTLCTLKALKGIRDVRVWDDRSNQLKHFYEELRHLRKSHAIDTFRVSLVRQDASQRKMLPAHMEKQLVAGMVARFNASLAAGTTPERAHHSFRPPTSPLRIQQTVLYTGILLDARSTKALTEHPALQRSWVAKLTADHVTLSMGRDPEYLRTNGGEGAEVALEAYAFGELSGRVIAVSVRRIDAQRTIRTRSRVAHVTVGISEGGRAKESNEIETWTPLTPLPLRLNGVVAEKVVDTIVETCLTAPDCSRSC